MRNTVNPSALEELRKLEKAATPGPWAAQLPSLLHGTDHGGIDIGPLRAEFFDSEPDLRLVVALRNAAPALLDAVEAAIAWKKWRWGESMQPLQVGDYELADKISKFQALGVALEDGKKP